MPQGPYGITITRNSAKLADIVRAFEADFPDHSRTRLPCRLAIRADLPPEGFQISVGKTALVEAGSPTGLVWGLQQLRKFASAGQRPRDFRDQPAWEFRGVSLDVARRYHSLDTLRKLIRTASLARVSVVNLHLTDDQNWMFPTQEFLRPERFNRTRKPAYSPAELRSLDAYARSRGVSLVPEVDVPGHCAILCKSDNRWRFPGTKNCIDFRSNWVRGRIRSMIGEAMDLFPHAPYIHLGGDEASYPKGGSNDGAFVDFLGEMTDLILKRGRTPLLWEGFPRSHYALQRISKKVRVISWSMNSYRPANLIKDGFSVINATWDPFYVVGHYSFNAFTLAPLPRLYKLDPRHFGRMSNEGLTLNTKRGISGSMLCWWEGTERDALRVLPERIMALGTALWGPKKRPEYAKFARQTARDLAPLFPGRKLQVGPVVTNSRPDDPHFSADELADGDATTVGRFWLAYPLPASATLDLQRPRRCQRVHIVPFFAARRRTYYFVEVSADGRRWDRVAENSGALPTSAGFWHTFAARSVRFVRLTVTESDQHPPGVGRVHELSVR